MLSVLLSMILSTFFLIVIISLVAMFIVIVPAEECTFLISTYDFKRFFLFSFFT